MADTASSNKSEEEQEKMLDNRRSMARLVRVSRELETHQTFGDGVLRQLGGRMEIQFVHDPRFMKLHGFDGNIQERGDVFGALPFRDEL